MPWATSSLRAALPADTPVGYAQGADIGIDVLLNIQNATGGSGDDTIIGNSFNNILDGGIGADSLTGRRRATTPTSSTTSATW